MNEDGNQKLLSLSENKDSIKKLFESINTFKWDLSERQQSMTKLQNMFISSLEVRALKKEGTQLEDKINQIENKALGMFKSPVYEQQ